MIPHYMISVGSYQEINCRLTFSSYLEYAIYKLIRISVKMGQLQALSLYLVVIVSRMPNLGILVRNTL